MSEALGTKTRQRKLDFKANVDERLVQLLEQLGQHVLGERSAVTTVVVKNSLQALAFVLALKQHQKFGVLVAEGSTAENLSGLSVY